jgi:hypothetical protein
MNKDIDEPNVITGNSGAVSYLLTVGRALLDRNRRAFGRTFRAIQLRSELVPIR